MTHVEYFLEQRTLFSSAVDRAVHTSNSVSGQFVEPRFGWGTWVYARLCLSAHSVLLLLRSYLDEKVHSSVDHISVANLCRSILEAHVFLEYLMEEGISEPEWLLRKWTLDLHDCTSRIRLFKGLGVSEQEEAHKNQRDLLRRRMGENMAFSQLPEETRKAILGGERIYVRGMRAALKNAGWDPSKWDGIYNYLSGASHNQPISFYRMGMAGVDFLSVQPYQYMFMGVALEHGHQAIDKATRRIGSVFFPD